MRLSSDSKEFIALLNSQGVDYLIVGAYRLAFHARPRFTGDLDIPIRPTLENAAKVVAVLNGFGFAELQRDHLRLHHPPDHSTRTRTESPILLHLEAGNAGHPKSGQAIGLGDLGQPAWRHRQFMPALGCVGSDWV
jgi:hypothetical protein